MERALKTKRKDAGRFWVWLYYQSEDYPQIEAALQPWDHWGSLTGSATGFNCESDISWGYNTREVATAKAKELHSRLANVKHRTRIVDTLLESRSPLPPDVLVGALQDRIHPTSGRLLAAKPIKTRRTS